MRRAHALVAITHAVRTVIVTYATRNVTVTVYVDVLRLSVLNKGHAAMNVTALRVERGHMNVCLMAWVTRNSGMSNSSMIIETMKMTNGLHSNVIRVDGQSITML